jgi:hypothetical protein
MTTARIAAVGLSLVVTSVVSSAQQRGAVADSAGPPERPASTVVERAYTPNTFSRSRQVQTRRSSDGREDVTNVVEMPGLDGRLAPVQEVRTETVRTGGSATRTTQQVVEFVGPGQRVVVGTTESEEQTSANATQTVESTRLWDINGRLGPKIQQVESTRSATPDSARFQTTVLQLGTNGALEATERTEHSERRVGANGVRTETTQLVRDPNGRWEPSETRTRDARGVGASEQVDEETVERRDLNGKLTVTERSITRRSVSNGRNDELVETYAQEIDGYVASQAPLQLTRRVRRSTTPTADGGRSTVEEVEARSIVSPGDPLRLTQRNVETVRRIGADRWLTERQVFERDVNGRMSLVLTETEETAAK